MLKVVVILDVLELFVGGWNCMDLCYSCAEQSELHFVVAYKRQGCVYGLVGGNDSGKSIALSLLWTFMTLHGIS